MATFKFTGTITVNGIKSKRDAIATLSAMLESYDDMNPDSDSDIIIHWDKCERIKRS